LRKQEMLMSENVKEYYEKEVDNEKHGFAKWIETFKDSETG